MKMHILSGGRLRMQKRVYLPGAAPEEMIELPVSCFLFIHPYGNLLFDTGCHPKIAVNPEQRWGPMARFVIPAMAADDNIISQLGRVNLTPDDIDIVVNLHLHCGHCGCNEFSPRRRSMCTGMSWPVPAIRRARARAIFKPNGTTRWR